MYEVVYNGSTETVVHKNVYANTMQKLCAENENIILLDADLMNSSATYGFWRENTKQVINVGIAEANMMGIAAGLSAVGRIPYVHTFGPFASRRSYDQTFMSIGYAGNSVRIYGSDPGVTAAFNGGTHMPFEDMALMRAIPGSKVFDIADAVQFAWVLREVKTNTGVTYMRSTRKSYKQLYSEDSTFEIGKANLIQEGSDLTIVACGLMVGEAMEAANLLSSHGISVRVLDMFTVKPLDHAAIRKAAQETGAIVTAENHNIIGGLGEAIAASLLEHDCAVPFARHGVQDCFGQVGSQDYLQKVYGLTAEALVET
ncbi:MAG TPA: transketolase C-terminal domain-containing protein, partial [Clostridia bacterium]|nr:transketolase C-terminal domain-containing protein [Clostridia bacterium]